MNDASDRGSGTSGPSPADLSYISGAITNAVRKVKPSLAATALDATTHFDDVGISSIELITIVFEIEDFFDIQIVDSNLDGFNTYGEACKIVGRLLAAKQAAAGGSRV